MKFFTRCIYLLAAAMLMSVSSLFAQDVTVRGVIVNNDGDPLIGAAITVVGDNTLGASADLDGRFVMNVPADAVLEVSYLGYKTVTAKVYFRVCIP